MEKTMDQTTEKTGVAGTEFQTPEELAAAYQQEHEQRANLEKKLGEQGNELGSLRKQTETLAETLKEAMTSGNKGNMKDTRSEEKPVDYTTKLADVEERITKLDPADDRYQEKLAKLVRESNKIAQEEQHQKTLGAASQIFKQELDERDIRATQNAFLDANPTFNTPEMQAHIKEAMANDRTGMLDPLAAYYQIQRDDAALAAKAASDEKAEIQKRLDLAEGKQKTGTVIVKGQSLGGAQTKHERVSGKEADEGALAALRAARGET